MKRKIAFILCALAFAAAAASDSTAKPAPAVVDEDNVEAEIVASLEANVAKTLARLQNQ